MVVELVKVDGKDTALYGVYARYITFRWVSALNDYSPYDEDDQFGQVPTSTSRVKAKSDQTQFLVLHIPMLFYHYLLEVLIKVHTFISFQKRNQKTNSIFRISLILYYHP